MSFAIDLSPRQTSRTLEQAVRHRAEVLVEPRTWEDATPLLCHMEPPAPPDPHRSNAPRRILLSCDLKRTDNASLLRAAEQTHASDILDAFSRLVGTYCDLAIRMGEHVFLASSDVVKVETPPPHLELVRLHLSAPPVLQVAQRRRFRRVQLAESSRVWLRAPEESDKATDDVGWLCNISPEGLACRVESDVANRLWIGDRVRVVFTLTPTDTQRFAFEAMICNKTPAGSEGKMILGLNFIIDPEHAESVHLSETLRRRLWNTGSLIKRRGDQKT